MSYESITTHGMSKTQIYKLWAGIKSRCQNKRDRRYKDYGAKGITLCERWQQFVNFLADMGDRPEPQEQFSIDRIDNTKGYSPENCRWATKTEQMVNRTTTIFLEFKGETLCLAHWAKRMNTSKQALRHRLQIGWSIEKTLTIPVKRGNR